AAAGPSRWAAIRVRGVGIPVRVLVDAVVAVKLGDAPAVVDSVVGVLVVILTVAPLRAWNSFVNPAVTVVVEAVAHLAGRRATVERAIATILVLRADTVPAIVHRPAIRRAARFGFSGLADPVPAPDPAHVGDLVDLAPRGTGALLMAIDLVRATDVERR